MATVTKSIGATGRDYATIALWDAFVPADLVTAGDSHVGEMYNDAEFTGGTDIGAHTTDSTHTMTLTAASGQSFMDNANVRTNALRYNRSNGVGIKTTTNYKEVLTSILTTYITISRLQMFISNSGSRATRMYSASGTSVPLIKDCIFETTNTLATNTALVLINNSRGINLVSIIDTTAATNGFVISRGPLIGCLAVRPSNRTAAGYGYIRDSYATAPIIQSCATFGFTGAINGTFDTTNSKNNATDVASGLPGSSNQYSVTYSSSTPFQNATSASSAHDFRSIDGTALADAGFRDSTDGPNDISGTARDSTPTIGVWELAAAASYDNKSGMFFVFH